jgi:xylulokinase
VPHSSQQTSFSSPDITAWNPIESTIRPDPNVTDPYNDLFANYLALHPATLEISHRRAAIETPPFS